MKAVIGIVMLTLGVVSPDMAGECDMASFYTELGCTPVARADGGLCPESFTCPDLHPDPTKCYYNSEKHPEVDMNKKVTTSRTMVAGCARAESRVAGKYRDLALALVTI